MSRSGYVDYCDDPLQRGRWRAAVNSAIYGKRGQVFLREALTALDAIPDKRLIAGELIVDGWQPPRIQGEEVIVGADELCDQNGMPHPMGGCCLLGAVAKVRGMSVEGLDPEDSERVCDEFGIANAMAREIVFWNDEGGFDETPEERWARMWMWVCDRIKPTEGEDMTEIDKKYAEAYTTILRGRFAKLEPEWTMSVGMGDAQRLGFTDTRQLAEWVQGVLRPLVKGDPVPDVHAHPHYVLVKKELLPYLPPAETEGANG